MIVQWSALPHLHASRNDGANAKLWQYSNDNKTLKLLALHDRSRFAIFDLAVTSPLIKTEESSGMIDA